MHTRPASSLRSALSAAALFALAALDPRRGFAPMLPVKTQEAAVDAQEEPPVAKTLVVVRKETMLTAEGRQALEQALEAVSNKAETAVIVCAEEAEPVVRRLLTSPLPVLRSYRPHPKPAPVVPAVRRGRYADRSVYAERYMARYVAPGGRQSPRTKRVRGLSARNQTRPQGHAVHAR